MRKSLGLATFLALCAGTVAVSAHIVNDGKMKGSDTLKDVTIQVLSACGSDVSGIIYDGGGSSNGQSEMVANNQQIAPMSRAINSAGCTGNNTGEGIVIGLDGISIVTVASTATLCAANPVGGEDCNQATDASTGLAYTRTFDTALSCDTGGAPDESKCDAVDAALYTCNAATLKCSYTLGGGFSGTSNDWKDALRLIYGGVDANDADNITLRDCDSPARVALANNWGNLFESSCGTGCTQLQHAFRRDDESGTTDTFVSSLGLPSVALNNGIADCTNSTGTGSGCVSRTPFCNALWADTDNVATAACTKDADCFSFDCDEAAAKCRNPRVPYYSDMQDFDRIRRPCMGTGNLPGPPSQPTGASPPAAPTEQVCNRDGTLGLVLPIQPPPVGISTDNYPKKDCAKGLFFNSTAFGVPTVQSGVPTIKDRCPNGDSTFFSGCLLPTSLDGDAACINGKNNLPTFKADSANATASDGRVYNRYLRKGGTGSDKDQLPKVVRNTKQADVVNAFYKIHTTRSAVGTTGFKNTCDSEADATSQIGCLTIASQCSIGFAGNSAASFTAVNSDQSRASCNSNTDCGTGGTCVAKCFGSLAACSVDGDCAAPADKPASLANCGVCEYPSEGAAALEVAALEPSDTCVRKLLPGSTGVAYPIARKLYLNSLDGFQNLAAQSQTAASHKSELDLAQCFSTDSIMHPVISATGFITIGNVSTQPGSCTPASSLFCEAQCGTASCADNTDGIVTRTSPVVLEPSWTPDDTNVCGP